MQIKDLAIGDGFVHLMEGGNKIKFYVLAHNYESERHGANTGLPRESGGFDSEQVHSCRTKMDLHHKL